MTHVIHTYTRKQAIADGVLVDVSELAREAGYRISVAITAAVYEQYVRVPSGVTGQDETGRLWDILWMCHFAIKTGHSHSNVMLFELIVRNDRARKVTLKAVCGPDDDRSPCLTIMNLEED